MNGDRSSVVPPLFFGYVINSRLRCNMATCHSVSKTEFLEDSKKQQQSFESTGRYLTKTSFDLNQTKQTNSLMY